MPVVTGKITGAFYLGHPVDISNNVKIVSQAIYGCGCKNFPASTAVCERRFSAMERVKSDMRASVLTKILLTAFMVVLLERGF